MIIRERTFSASSIHHEVPNVNSKQFEAVTEELILLSTRNANLEQQLDEMKKKYDSLQVLTLKEPTNGSPLSFGHSSEFQNVQTLWAFCG